MEENKLNAREEEAVHPQDPDAREEELVQPQELNDADFDEYINNIKNGTLTSAEPVGTTEEERDMPEARSDIDDSEEVYKSFKTQDEYQREIDSIIGSRLKAHREVSEKWNEVEEIARSIYGKDEQNATERLLQEFYMMASEKEGKTPEEFKETQALMRDAEKWRAQNAAHKHREAIYTKWQTEAAELRVSIPEFDLEKAFENPVFHNAMVNGASVAQAYIASTQQNTTAPKKRQTITQNANGGFTGAPVKRDPSAMSEAEFKEYIERLKDSL